MGKTRLCILLSFILLGSLGRIIPHPPNLAPNYALALHSASSLGSGALALLTTLMTLFVSDLYLGFHSTMPYVYLSFALIVFLGTIGKVQKTLLHNFCFSLISSLLFFLITNFGAFLTLSLYPKTFDGLFLCYLAALPFLKFQIFGDLFYNTLIFMCLRKLRSKEKNSLLCKQNTLS